jgi:hypothetical protein
MAKPDVPNTNSFGTFLDSINSSQAAPPAPGGTPFTLLTTLAGTGPQLVPDLLTATGLGFSDFTSALHTMQEAGLVTLTGVPGQERVALTTSGEQVAKMNVKP